MRKKNIPWMLISFLLLMSLTACNTSPTSGSITEKGPVLSDALTSGCGNPGVYATDKTGLAVGTKAINFTLKDTNGEEVRLSRLLAEKPVVMIFGSFS